MRVLFHGLRLGPITAGACLFSISACGGDAETQKPPEPVVEHPAIVVGPGNNHACAVLETGEGRCWGSNTAGQLGDGTTLSSLSPVAVAGLDNLVDIRGGYQHTCALRGDGAVFCWGDNEFGQLGIGTYDPSPTPVQVKGLADVVEIAVHWDHGCARRKDGTMLCWGSGDGRIGDGSLEKRPEPVVVPGIADAVDIAVGWGHSCALSSAGTAKCWGTYNAWGQIGDGTNVDTLPVPVDVLDLSNAKSLVTGSYHTCAITDMADVFCWGNNQAQQVTGANLADNIFKPQKVDNVLGVKDLAATGFSTCALLTTGKVQCWGSMTLDQNNWPTAPVEVAGAEGAVDIEGGAGEFACLLDEKGRILCWGENSAGELGNGTAKDSKTPVEVVFP